MFEEGILQVSLLFPEDVHHRDRIVEHAQGDVFCGNGGKNGGLRLMAVDHRQGTHVVQMGMRDEDRLQLPCDPSILWEALQAIFFGMESGIQKKRYSIKIQEIRIGPDFLPPTKDRERPGHRSLIRS
jgi:hypothetical protein